MVNKFEAWREGKAIRGITLMENIKDAVCHNGLLGGMVVDICGDAGADTQLQV